MTSTRINQATWPVWVAFGTVAVLLSALASVGVIALERTTAAKDAVILSSTEYLVSAERLRADTEHEVRLVRVYLAELDPDLIDSIDDTRARIRSDLDTLGEGLTDPEMRARLAELQAATRAHSSALDQVIQSEREHLPRPRGGFEAQLAPERRRLDAALNDLAKTVRDELAVARERAQRETQWALYLVEGTAAACIVAAFALTLLLRRALLVQAEQRELLEASNERLEAMNRDLESFAATVAHDLRNALAPISLTAAMLRRQTGDTTPAGAGERIQRALGRATRMMDALLAFARGGRGSTANAESSIRSVLQGVIDEEEPLRQERNALIEVAVDGDPRVPVSEGLLHAVLANLVGNALKYIGESLERRVRVEVGPDPQSDGVLIVVSDTGPGIPPEHLTRIFEPFFRVPGQAMSGAGIGLATVSRIVHAHGGRIEVESVLGRGTRFSIRLPLIPARDEAPPPPLH